MEAAERLLELVVGLGDTVQDLLNGGGTVRQRRLGRLMVACVFLVNLFVFLSNLRWLLDRNQLPRGPVRPPVAAAEAGEGAPVEYPPVFDVEQQFGRSKYLPFLPKKRSAEFERDPARRPVPNIYNPRAPKVVTLVSTEIMTATRNLVGSVHWWHPEKEVVLYQIGPLTPRHQSEIELWTSVEVVPLKAVVEPLCADDRLNITTGPVHSLRRQIEAQEAAGQSSVVLEPDLEQVLKGVKSALPMVMWHAAKTHMDIVFLDPSAYLSGWIDNVFKALLRDGQFFVQDETVSGGCLAEAQGYVYDSQGFRDILLPQLHCAVGGECPSASRLISELPSDKNWWGASPDDVAGYQCHPTKMAKVAVEESFKLEEVSAATDWLDDRYLKKSSGAIPQYDCRLLNLPSAPAVQWRTKIKASSAVRAADGGGGGGGGGGAEAGGTAGGAGGAGRGTGGAGGAAVAAANGTGGLIKNLYHIAVGMPSTTTGTQLVAGDSLPLVNLFLPSFLSTIDRQTTHFRYTIYIGYDLGDVVYDDPKKANQIKRRMAVMIGDYPVEVQAVRFPVSLSTTYVWNGLFDIAMADGADYFLTVHDDTEFYPLSGKYWSEVLVGSLANNALWPNFGVAGPLDMRNPKTISHMFVHKTHRDIFTTLYPPTLSNTEHDEWASRVYGYKNTFLHTGVQVYNTHRFTGRAKACTSGATAVGRALQVGLQDLRAWLSRQLGAYSSDHILSTMLE